MNRSTILDAYRPHLHQRWNHGCHDTAELHREITALGFSGSVQTVRRCLRNLTPSAPTRDFAEMMRDLRGDQLPQWMDRVEHDPLPAFHSLVNGLRRDQDAVVAGLSSPWSSGQVEGQNTRVILKRAGYGRANFDLLRKRIPHRT